MLKARIPVGNAVITVFNCHLKSKLGELDRPKGAPFPPAADLVNYYDPAGRAMGSLRAGLRRMAEAWVLRREILKELEAGNPVMVLGDFNDSDNAVSFRDHHWRNAIQELRMDAPPRRDAQRRPLHRHRKTTSSKKRSTACACIPPRNSLCVNPCAIWCFTSGLWWRVRIYRPNPDVAAFSPRQRRSAWSDGVFLGPQRPHHTDGSHPEAPYNKLASDHGQIIAHMQLKGKENSR